MDRQADGRRTSGSMGPRARARGNTAKATPWPVCMMLQWGHERALVEIGNLAAIEWVVYRASMGPRARARGNDAAERVGVGVEVASMGPRARARGNTKAGNRSRYTPDRFNGATSARSWPH